MARIDGDDGRLADEVGEWVKEKHSYLRRYVDISRAARKKYLGPGTAGATYFDLFCATGRSRIRTTGEWIDGSAITAWKASVEGGAPFSEIYISDIDRNSLDACTERLRELNAPVIPIHASAVEAVEKIATSVNGYGLHLAFLDPYNLETLDFRIIERLARLKRVDVIIHLSAMDLQRNLEKNLKGEKSAFDFVVPGWRETLDTASSQQRIRSQFIEYWRQKITNIGKWPSEDQRLITAGKNQSLYWLLLVSSHPLPHKFWSTAINPEGQGKLF